ncbi:SMODS and SLOG-associating 2TM effector domain-containing protein OS=Streptomyces microflavus OX=1919 GN=Smic_52850 PE=4 SV=1 [Streptomyces microflavus]
MDLPPASTEQLGSLTELMAGLLAPGWVSQALAQDPEGIHVLARAVHRDLPESVDAFVRTR